MTTSSSSNNTNETIETKQNLDNDESNELNEFVAKGRMGRRNAVVDPDRTHDQQQQQDKASHLEASSLNELNKKFTLLLDSNSTQSNEQNAKN
jgi:hypothetical protein